MKKIKVLDVNERDKALSYWNGFNTGVFNTVSSIVEIRKRGLALSKLYKLIERKYKEELRKKENENNSN